MATALASTPQPDKADFVECEACRLVIATLQDYLKQKQHWTEAVDIGVEVCLSLGKYTKGVCEGAVNENAMIAVDSVINRIIDPDFLCKELEFCTGPEYVYENFTQWVSDVMASKPVTPRPKPTGRSSYKFAQMSDIHLDFFYKPGTQNDCDLPVCCRNGTGTAGEWGDYNCDLPVKTFEAALQQLQPMSPDFIIVTGDMPPHDIWNQSDSYNMAYQSVASSLLKQYFPTTPVYAILGNHACFPVNQFDYESNSESEKWLLDGFAEHWGWWLDQEAIDSFRKTGTYAMLHKDTNLRMIGLNTQACNNQNFFLWVNSTDPGGEIRWLWETLLAAEKNGEMVYMFGHYYLAYSGCLKYWSYHMNALIDRFENIIAGMYFGHSHADSFHVHRGVYTNKPTAVHYVDPSITTYTNRNPSFRVYEADTDTKLITDYTEYRINLPSANINPSVAPVYNKAYSFKSQYGVPDMSPDSIYGVALDTANNETTALTYLYNHETGVNPPSSCDMGCRHDLLCTLSYGVGDQIEKCNGSPPSWKTDLNELLFPPWVYKKK